METIVQMWCASSASTGSMWALKLSSWDAVGKGSLMCAIFGCSTWLCKNGPWFPSEEIKSPMGSILGWSLCMRISFPFACSKYVLLFCITRYLGNTKAIYICPLRRGTEHFYCCLRGACFAICPAIAARRDLLTMGRMHAPESDLIWSLLHVSKALFHSVPHYTAFPLVNPIPRCKGQKCWVLSWIS